MNGCTTGSGGGGKWKKELLMVVSKEELSENGSDGPRLGLCVTSRIFLVQ